MPCFLIALADDGVNIGNQFRFGNIGIKDITAFQTLGSFISAILPNIYIISGLIFFFLLLFGGFMFMLQSGEENPEAMAASKKAITAAVAGLALIFFSYWLMQIVQFITGIKFFESGL
jgi:hypothetical protein